MRISAKVDYGMRALLTLAASGRPMTVDALAEAQQLPTKYLGAILNDLRRAEIVLSKRGIDHGYRLARPGADISVADVVSVLDGQPGRVNGMRPETTRYEGAAEHLQRVWLAVRASLLQVLETMTLDDVVKGDIRRPDPLAGHPAPDAGRDSLATLNEQA